MARAVRETKIDSRAARSKLPTASEPYWRTIHEGAHLGYYRGSRVTKWVARFRPPGAGNRYVKVTLGEADDSVDADGERILDYRQAMEAARTWFDRMVRGERRRGPYTVGDALDDYLDAHTGRSIEKTRARADKIIRPALGKIELVQLTYKQVADWHRDRAASPAKLRTSALAEKQNERAIDTPDAVRRRQSTANRDLTVLKAALNKAFADEKVTSDSAWRRVKPFANADAAKLRYLTDDEARRIINGAGAESGERGS